VVEDEAQLGRTLQTRLQEAGFIVDLVGCAAEAEAAAATAPFALIILDRRLPDGDGLDSIKALRRELPGVRIIMLTALDSTSQKILGLDAGADDYLTKPFEPDELVARVRAALRRPGAAAQPPIICANLCYDPNHREFTINGEVFVLKRREHLILESLMTRSRRVVQREFFMETAYGFDDDIQSNTLDAHISRLRAKLGELGASVQIRPVRGVGYMLTEV
jgi:DNA-binding response OmpR family regulator